MPRIELDAYFMSIADLAKERGTCIRRKVGSVITIDNRIISTGFNGSSRGSPHCDEIGCIEENGHCIASSHSEENSIINAKRDLFGATIYTTSFPCLKCLRMIRNSGIIKIVYRDPYPYSDKENLVFKNIESSLEWVKYESKS